VLRAERGKHGEVAVASPTEAKVLAHQHGACVQLFNQKAPRKIGGLGLRELERERLDHDLERRGLASQQVELARQGRERRLSAAADDHSRVRIERQHDGRQALLARQADGLRQDGLMTPMHAVEIADRDERWASGPQHRSAEHALMTHAAALLRRGATFQSRRDRSGT
jgi:hypothetical protein